MILDLNQIPFRHVLPIIEWCFKNSINTERCVKLLEVWYSDPPVTNDDWTIDIPEEYMSFVVMKWLS